MTGASQPETVRPEYAQMLPLLFTLIDDVHSIVVHVTASRPGEGTSTIARQIAAAAARSSWCKVALVNANYAGATTPDTPGLVDRFERGEELTLSPAQIDSAPLAIGVLSTSHRGTQRMESIRAVYAQLKIRYNLTIVDCPPVLSGQDTAFAALADGTILVIEAERTPVSEVARAHETLQQLGAMMLGVILNKRRRRVPRILGWLT